VCQEISNETSKIIAKMKTYKIIIMGSALIVLSAVNLLAQTARSKVARKVQVTFAYPIGSAGSSSKNYANNFSFNILYGLNGGVNGFELGSLWNHNEGDVKGFQLSGMINTTVGNSSGLIISGIVNHNNESVSGAAISGVLNYSGRFLRGLQLAGVTNIGLDSLNGIAVSGILNKTNGSARGFHLSVINLAQDFAGVQLGVLNYARRLKGVQLGVVNISGDAKDAFPVGLISIVKNGYYELDLTGGEAIYSNLTYKMGVERLYTVFIIGFSGYKGNPVYSYGGGFGTSIFLADRQYFNIEMSSNQLFVNNDWDGPANSLNKLDLNYKFFVLSKLSLLIGPSFNVYLTKTKINGEYGTINIPYTIYEHEYNTKKLFMWVGLNAGVSIRF
jgi:hypothetical protein